MDKGELLYALIPSIIISKIIKVKDIIFLKKMTSKKSTPVNKVITTILCSPLSIKEN